MARKCPSCGRWFRSKQAIRQHLRWCKEYKKYKLEKELETVDIDLLPEWTKEEIEPAETKEESELLPKWTKEAE